MTALIKVLKMIYRVRGAGTREREQVETRGGKTGKKRERERHVGNICRWARWDTFWPNVGKDTERNYRQMKLERMRQEAGWKKKKNHAERQVGGFNKWTSSYEIHMGRSRCARVRQAERQADKAESQRAVRQVQRVTAEECSRATCPDLHERSMFTAERLQSDTSKQSYSQTQQHGARPVVYKTRALFF